MTAGAPKPEPTEEPRRVDRYDVFGPIAAGGMATVHFARQRGPVGFSRVVAVKRLHRRFSKDPQVFAMLVDEARLAGRVQHPNVLPTLDVVRTGEELLLVMEYVHGESLQRLLRTLAERKARLPRAVVASIVGSVLYGLHAAHEAKSERGEHLAIVHRDVSPQNILVGADGVTRVLDFGIAKAQQRIQRSTVHGQIKGKLSYMSPEQIAGEELDRRTDVWAASVVLWECLTGRRLFPGSDPGQIVLRITKNEIPRPSEAADGIPPELDEVVMRGLAKEPDARFVTARAMALALEDAVKPATPREVEEVVAELASEALGERARKLTVIEREASEREEDGAATALTHSTAPSTPTPRGAPPGGVRPVVVGLSALFMLSLGGLVAWLTLAEAPRDARGPGSPRADASTGPGASPTEPPTGGSAGGSDGSPRHDPSGSAPSAAAPPVPSRAPAPGATLPSVPASTRGPRTGPCDPPFSYERVGDTLIKKWKPECLD